MTDISPPVGLVDIITSLIVAARERVTPGQCRLLKCDALWETVRFLLFLADQSVISAMFKVYTIRFLKHGVSKVLLMSLLESHLAILLFTQHRQGHSFTLFFWYEPCFVVWLWLISARRRLLDANCHRRRNYLLYLLISYFFVRS